MSAPKTVPNAMTVDVEEWFQVSAFDDVVDRGDWDAMPSRVERSTERLLEAFGAAGVRATFFVLGWIAERHPDLVRRIARAGHEVGCHGYDHRMLHDLPRETLARDTDRARKALQDLSGQPVAGYRAASFSIGRRNLWALDVLVECGFEYDSSLFPVVHDRYGIPGAPREIHLVTTPGGASLVEVPPTTVQIAGMTLPAAGGGYLRLFPLAVTDWAIRRLNDHEGRPAVVYLHPWEVDPDQPRVRVGPLARWRHYGGLHGMTAKLTRLMRRYRFTTMEEIVDGFAGSKRAEPVGAGAAGGA